MLKIGMAFRNFPDFEGIKTSGVAMLKIGMAFRNFPDFEGIKTVQSSLSVFALRSGTSLTLKGLRPTFPLRSALSAVPELP